MTLLELAERCEQATGPDRVLELRLAIMSGAVAEGAVYREDIPDGCAWRAGVLFAVPSYTASLDAAMTLVPEGWDAHLRTHTTTDGTAFAMLTDRAWLDEEPDGRLIQGDAATLPLALCAAALKARAAQGIEAAEAAETVEQGSVHKSPVGNADAPDSSSPQ